MMQASCADVFVLIKSCFATNDIGGGGTRDSPETSVQEASTMPDRTIKFSTATA